MLAKCIGVATYEEIVWRVFVQSASTTLFDYQTALFVTAVGFTLMHFRSLRVATTRARLEMFAFALALGTLFGATADPLLVVAVHTVRNFGVLLAWPPKENYI